jgi:hypothetical protein
MTRRAMAPGRWGNDREPARSWKTVPFVARLDAALARGSSPAGRSPAFPSTVSGDASMKTL